VDDMNFYTIASFAALCALTSLSIFGCSSTDEVGDDFDAAVADDASATDATDASSEDAAVAADALAEDAGLDVVTQGDVTGDAATDAVAE